VETLAKCLAVVHQGQIWAGTNELEIILQAMAKRSHFEPVSASGVKLLTSREAEAAALVADGLRNRGISEQMKLSPHTVKNYLYHVYEKLGISSRVELTTRVLEHARTESSGDVPQDRKQVAG
jgi:DNA-binding NarL/FixJ family response regulator